MLLKCVMVDDCSFHACVSTFAGGFYGSRVWDRYVSIYVKRIIYTLIYIYTLYICDEIMKGQKKGKCFWLISSRMISSRKFVFSRFFGCSRELYATIITEEL